MRKKIRVIGTAQAISSRTIRDIKGTKRRNITRITSVSVRRSSSPMLTLIIMRETASMPAGIAQKAARRLFAAAKAEIPIVPTKASISQLTIRPRAVW